MRTGRLALLLCLSLQAARFEVDTPGKIVRLSDPQIAENGWIAAIVTRSNFEENRNDSQLVLIEGRPGGAQRILTHDRRGLAQPRWSPTSDRLAFLASSDGKTQLFVLAMSGGEAQQITKAPEGVQQFAWSPDGTQFAFVTRDESPQRTGLERHNKSFEIAHNDFLVTTQPLPAHLWTVPVAGGSPRRITQGSWTLPISFPPSPPAAPLTWTPDGKSVAIVKISTAYSGDADQSSVQIVDIATGVMRPLTGRAKHEGQPLISPDGKSVAYWYPRNGETRNVNEIYVAPIEGGEGRSVTRGIDRNVQRAIWLSDSRSLLVSANDGTGVSLWVQPVDGAARKVFTGNAVPTATFWLDASVSRGGAIAFTASEPNSPVELYLADANPGGSQRKITSFNHSIAVLELGRVESVRWQGPDGFANDGVVTYPPGFAAGRKYPLVLYIHGGPRSASKAAFSNYAQLFAAQGWVVFEPNYRGSDNLGNAFQSAIWNDAGVGPGRDVMSGVEYLRQRGFVDESRIATCGWSYGGYMTTWLLGNYPKVWRAAVAGAAVTDWMDQYNLGDSNVRRGSAFGGSPYGDAKRMEAMRVQSPMAYAQNVVAPTLIMATTGDYRVPITQSYRFYHALRDRGIPTQFIGYPVAGHSPTDPVHQRDVLRRYVGWLKHYLDSSANSSASGHR